MEYWFYACLGLENEHILAGSLTGYALPPILTLEESAANPYLVFGRAVSLCYVYCTT